MTVSVALTALKQPRTLEPRERPRTDRPDDGTRCPGCDHTDAVEERQSGLWCSRCRQWIVARHRPGGDRVVELWVRQ